MQSRMLDGIRFYLLSQYYWWRGFLLIYKEQATMWLVYSFFSVLYSYITVTVIYSVSSGIAGWSYYQMLFLVSTATMMFNALYYVIDIAWIMYLLRQGGIDPYLVRPYGRMTIFLSLEGNLGSTSAVFGALALLLYSAFHIGISAFHMLLYLVLVAAGVVTLILFALMLLMLVYHLLKSAQFAERLLSFAQQAAQYPLGVYGLLGQLIFTLILPIGVASYYPARAFMSGISLAGFFGPLAISAVISVVSYLLFYKLQKYYTSGGG